VYVGIIFIFLARFFKLKSLWNQNKSIAVHYDEQGKKRVGDVWTSQKQTSDFLHHLKFELVQYAFFGQMFYLSLTMVPGFRSFMVKQNLSMSIGYIKLGLS